MSAAAELVETLRRQRDGYRRMLELSRSQEERIAAEDDEGLIDLLREQRSLKTELEGIASRIGPLRARVEGDLPSADREAVDALLEETRGVLAELVEIQKRQTEALSGRKEDVSERRRRLQDGRKAGRAYLQARRPDRPGAIDRSR